MKISLKSTCIPIVTLNIVAAILSACNSGTSSPSDANIHPVIKSIKDNFHIEDNSGYPDSLAPVYPNPYNLVTGDTAVNIYFTMKDSARVVLLVQNPLGDSVAVFKDAWIGGGSFTGSWQPKNSAGERLKAGLYFVTLRIINGGQDRDYINSELLSIEAN
jgi:hypothetical protein